MKVVWSRRAIRHLVRLREHIEKDSEQNVLLSPAALLRRSLYLNPIRRSVGPAGWSERVSFVVPNTPYIVPYRVRRERLELIAVFHGRQKWPLKL
jgi:toxin ParE1/3/4